MGARPGLPPVASAGNDRVCPNGFGDCRASSRRAASADRLASERSPRAVWRRSRAGDHRGVTPNHRTTRCCGCSARGARLMSSCRLVPAVRRSSSEALPRSTSRRSMQSQVRALAGRATIANRQRDHRDGAKPRPHSAGRRRRGQPRSGFLIDLGCDSFRVSLRRADARARELERWLAGVRAWPGRAKLRPIMSGLCPFPVGPAVMPVAVCLLALSACSRPEVFKQESFVSRQPCRGSGIWRRRSLAGARWGGAAGVRPAAPRLSCLGASERRPSMRPYRGRSPERAGIARTGHTLPARAMSRCAEDSRCPRWRRLIALWGFHSDEFRPVPPDPGRWPRPARHPRIAELEIADDRVSCCSNPAVDDLGGYAKGYALDRPPRSCAPRVSPMR